MAEDKVFTVDNIDGELCQFEIGQKIEDILPPISSEEFPGLSGEMIEKLNGRIRNANERYRMSQHREQMFASGFKAGMYIAKFDEWEEMVSFEFTDGTRKMLGYDGLADLPNEFASWEKTLVPEERETIVKLFWDTVKIHRQLPDISHAEYRMMKKDGSIIWVTGAGEFIRRSDGSLEIYMGCYREVTAEHEREEYLHIIEGVGKVFNFSIYIDVHTEKYRIISTNEYVESVTHVENTYDFLKTITENTVDREYREELENWFDGESILQALRKHGTVSKIFFSSSANAWFKGTFLISDYDENGEIAHIIYGCQNVDETKKKEIESQKAMMEQYKLLKSVANVYWSMHEIDLLEDTVTAYAAHKDVERIVDHEKGAAKMMRDTMIATVEPEYLNTALEFTDLSTVSERLRGKKLLVVEMIGKNLGWFTASFIPVERDEEGNTTKVVFVTKSINEIKKKEETLRVKSSTDELTGAYNRRAYEEAIADMISGDENPDFVYISVDVNGLKIINDTIGHSAGDELIIGAHTCLLRAFGTLGKVYRTGGDEFVVLINANDSLLAGALDSLEQATDRWSGELVESLSLSYGYVTRREHPEMSIQEIAVLADKRMYEAKSLHYRKQGVDRRGQKDAHIALCALYTKILKINLTQDSYQIVDMDASEKTQEMGFSESISGWLKSFGESGCVHPDDLDEYLSKTKIEAIEAYFAQGKTSMHIFYRRKYEDGFKQVMMEIIPANDYSAENHSYFLYVKNIDQ